MLISEALDNARKVSRAVRHEFGDLDGPLRNSVSARSSGMFFNTEARERNEHKLRDDDKPLYRSLKVLLKTQVSAFIDRYINKNAIHSSDLRSMVKSLNELFYAKLARLLSMICTANRKKFFELLRAGEENVEAVKVFWEEVSRTYAYFKSHSIGNIDLHRDLVKSIVNNPLVSSEMTFFLDYQFNNANAVLDILNRGEDSAFKDTSFELLPNSMKKTVNKDPKPTNGDKKSQTTTPLPSVIPSETDPHGVLQRSGFGSDSLNQGPKYPLKGSSKTLDHHPSGDRLPVDTKLLKTDFQKLSTNQKAPSKQSVANRSQNNSDLISFITDLDKRAEVDKVNGKKTVQFGGTGDEKNSKKSGSKVSRPEFEEIYSKNFYNYSHHESEHHEELKELNRLLF